MYAGLCGGSIINTFPSNSPSSLEPIIHAHQCEGKVLPLGWVKALTRKPVKSRENQLPALSGKRKTEQLLFRECGLGFATTHTNLPVQSRMDKNGASTGLYQPKPPCPSPGKGTPAANLPHSKAGRAWRGSARKLRWDSAGTLARRIGLGSLEDAALHWLELAGLTPPSAKQQRPGTGNPHLPGIQSQRRSASPVSLSPRECSGGGPGASGPPRTCWGRNSPFVFTCRRGPERQSPCPPLAGRALSRLWRPGH